MTTMTTMMMTTLTSMQPMTMKSDDEE